MKSIIYTNKNAELRIHHIIIAVLLMGLFGIFLFDMTGSFIVDNSNNTISIENLTSSGEEVNRSRFYDSISTLTEMTSEINEIGKYSPGGDEAAASSDESTSEGGFIKAGYRLISKIGNWIFKYPITIIRSSLSFFGLPQQFANVATASLVIFVAIVLASSILKNRI